MKRKHESYPDCFDCRYSYGRDFGDELLCEKQFHFCEEIDDCMWEGRIDNGFGKIVKCTDFKGKKYQDQE